MLRTISKIKYAVASDRGTNGSSSNGHWDCSKRDKAVAAARTAYDDAKANYDAAVHLYEDLQKENEWIKEKTRVYDGIYDCLNYHAPSLLTEQNVEGLNIGSSCLTNYLASIEDMKLLVQNKINLYEDDMRIASENLAKAQKIPCVWIVYDS